MYYLLDGTDQPRRWIDKRPFIKGVNWWRGAIIVQEFSKPLEFTLKPYSSGASDHALFMPAYLLSRPPLFRDDL